MISCDDRGVDAFCACDWRSSLVAFSLQMTCTAPKAATHAGQQHYEEIYREIPI